MSHYEAFLEKYKIGTEGDSTFAARFSYICTGVLSMAGPENADYCKFVTWAWLVHESGVCTVETVHNLGCKCTGLRAPTETVKTWCVERL